MDDTQRIKDIRQRVINIENKVFWIFVINVAMPLLFAFFGFFKTFIQQLLEA